MTSYKRQVWKFWLFPRNVSSWSLKIQLERWHLNLMKLRSSWITPSSTRDEDRRRTKLSISLNRIYIYTRIEFSPFPVNPLSVFTFHRSPHASLKIASRCSEINATSRIRSNIVELFLILVRDIINFQRIDLANRRWREFRFSDQTKPWWSLQFFI